MLVQLHVKGNPPPMDQQLADGVAAKYLKTACDYVHLTRPGSTYWQRILAQEMARLGWTEADLRCRLKNDPGKLALAARVRQETTLPIR